MTFHRSRLTAVTLATMLLLGAAACSDDSGDSADEPSQSTAVDAAPEDDVDPTGDVVVVSDDNGRPFGVDADGLATAMKTATKADRVEVDGSTFRLFFDDGSVDDVSAAINCSSMGHVKGHEDSIVLIYPDGEKPCED